MNQKIQQIMCLIINNDSMVPKVATEDITVYKVGIPYIKRLLWFKIEQFIPRYFLDFRYTKNRKQSYVTLEPEPFYSYRDDGMSSFRYAIHKGYHSYKDLKLAIAYAKLEDALAVGIFIIPKKSVYYEGDNGDIVSDTIIYKGLYK